MHMDAADILNQQIPYQLPPPGWMKAVDILSVALPGLAAVLSIGSGWLALRGAANWSAYLGIGAGVLSALAVCVIGQASRLRDKWLAQAYALGALGVNTADNLRHGAFD